MSRFVNEINDSPLAAERAEKDILGNKIDEYYSKLSLIAPQYSPVSTYVFDQLVFQEDTLYKCSVNCGPEEWNQYHWTEVNDLSDYIKNLQHINLIPYGSGKYSQVSSKKVNFATIGSGGRTYYAPMLQSGYGVYYFTYIDGRSLVTMTLSPDGGDGTWGVSSISIPQDYSSVIPSDASSSNQLVTTNTLDARLADFGGFKEVQGTGADLHPNVPSGEENSKLIYLVRDDSATGDDKYKEWIWDSGDPEADPPVAAQWKLIGDTTMHLEGYVQKVQIDGTEIPATSGTVNIPLAVADYYGTSATDGALSKEDKEKIDSYKYMYLSEGESGEKIYGNSPDPNLDVGFLSLGNYGYDQVPGFVAVGRAGQDECFFGNQGSDPAFGVYNDQSQRFTVRQLVTADSYILSNLENGKADKVIGATSGNLAAFDEDGNLMDSGIDPSQIAGGNLKQGLQGLQGTKIPANSDLNTYTTPGNYYIASANDMVLISHTPYAQMGLSDPRKTGNSQFTVYNMNGTASGRVMQVMYTIYSTNPTSDNAFGFWYRMNAGSSQTWGDWHRMLQTNGYAPYRYGSTTPSTATKSAELLKVKVGSTTTYQSLTIAATISTAASNQNMLVIATLYIGGNTPKIEAEVINHNFASSIGRVRFYAQNDSNLVTTYGIMFPDKDDLTFVNVTYTVLDHSGNLYESKAFPSFNNVWLLYNPILSSSTPTYTVCTDLYSKNSHHGPGLWCGYKNASNYLLITVKQISGGTAGDSILISFTGNQHGVMLKLCFGMASDGGFNGSTPTLHVLETNNLANAAYNPLFTSGGGVAKYYYDSTNKLYYFLLKTTTTNRMMCTVESANTENYYFEEITTAPSWLSSASNIATGHALPHITASRVGNEIGSSKQPVYVTEIGSIEPCSVADSRYFAGSSMWPAATAYGYVKSGITVTVTVDNMIENKTYTAQVVRTGGDSSQFNIKFQSHSVFNVYGHSQTTTNVTSYTLGHSLYPMMFMRAGGNIYIISY